MGFRIKDNEEVSDAVKRISLDQIDRARDRLDLRTRNKARAVHEARVCFKKIRAVLRLVYGEIGREMFKLENGVYRDAGRQLSAARDNVVVADTLEELVHHFNKELAEPDIKLLRKRLRKLRAHPQIDRDQVLPKVVEDLRSAQQRVDGWPINSEGFAALRPGLRRVYKKGRTRFELALAETTTENLHEWRKQVKYLWYQIIVLNAMWPKELDTIGHELGKLADYLSEDHDLALLRSRAVRQGELLGDSSDIEKLILLIDDRRALLQGKAQALGSRLYAEKPKSFINRYQSYWESWRPATMTNPADAEQMILAFEASSSSTT